MYDVINRKLSPYGLRLRGVLDVEPEDKLSGDIAGLILIGYLGGEMWSVFQRERRSELHPLDAWTRRVIEPLAKELSAVAFYPFEGPPWLPFQRWAMRAEGLGQSPIGPLIHPVFGPWHGYRAALGFKERLKNLPLAQQSVDVCASCLVKPCLSACPAGVFEAGAYEVPKCQAQMRRPNNACLTGGCLSRQACPVGAKHAYSQQQAAFHARAFLAFMDSSR